MAGMSDFNPRSRGGSDNSEPDAGEDQHISIHAPAEGATTRTPFFLHLYLLFQSTLPRRERLLWMPF